jgi:hypothetical protein
VVGLAAGPAAAKPSDNQKARQHWVKYFETTDHLTIQCEQNDNTPQFCESGVVVHYGVDDERLKVILTASGQHCSAIRFRFYERPAIDDQPVLIEQMRLAGTTRWLGPGESATFDEVYVAETDVAIVAEGRAGGCNEGRLLGWEGTMRHIFYVRERE